MKASLVKILACPVCQRSLKFSGTSSTHRFVNGLLRCVNGHWYQVKDEIPILKDPKLSQKEFVWRVEFPDLEKYDKVREEFASYLSEELREADRAMIQEMAKTCSKERLLLDVASGMGGFLLAISQQLKKGTNVLGTDIDDRPLRGAKLKLEEQKTYSRISLCAMDAKHLALQPQRFLCVTSFFGLDNIPETRKAFQEISRVMMPEGRLVMASLWLKEGSRSLALAKKLGVGTITTENGLTQTLQKTGFKIDSAEKFYSGKWSHNPMDELPIEGDWFAHTLVLAHKK